MNLFLRPGLTPYSAITQSDEEIVIQTSYGPTWAKNLGLVILSFIMLITVSVLVRVLLNIVESPFTIFPALFVIFWLWIMKIIWVHTWIAARNTIAITVKRDRIQRREGPVMEQDMNWTYDAAFITQIYLKGIYEKQNKRTVYRHGDLVIRLKTDTEYIVLSRDFFDKPASAQALAELIGTHLGLEPIAMREAYQAEPAKRHYELRKAAEDKAKFDPLLATRRPGEHAQKIRTPDLHLMARRDIIVIKGQNYQVKSAWQCSWQNGQTDQWIEAVNIKGSTFGIFFDQSQGQYAPYYMYLLTTKAMFEDDNFPDEYTWDGLVYQAQQYSLGQRHTRWNTSGEWLDIRQCVYTNLSGKRLRMIYVERVKLLYLYAETPILPHQIDDFLVWVA